MSGTVEWIASGLLCFVGVSIAGAYFLLRLGNHASEPGWWVKWDTPEGVRARRHRRDLGMAIIMVISLAVFAGVNYMDPLRAPLQYGYYWLVIVLMLTWLCLLAVGDLRHTIRVQRQVSRRRLAASLEQYLRAYGQTTAAHEQRPESDS